MHACCVSRSTMEPAKRGYLQKRTRPKAWRRQEWLRRYFVFDSVRLELHYFVSSAQFGTEPTDSRRKLCVAGVQVGNDAIVPAQHGDIGAADAQLCFCVTDMHDSRANLLLCASSDEDRDAWIAALRDALRKAQAASQSPASPRTPGIQAVSGTERSGEDLDHDENEKVVEDLDRATRDEAQAKMRADLKREAESRNLVADYAQLEKEAAEEAAKEAEVEAAAEQELGEDAVSEFDADLDHDSDAGDTQRRRLRRQALSEEAIEASFANELERAAVNEEDDSQDRFSSGGGDKGAVQNKVKSENGAARPAHTVGTSTSRHSLSPESEPGACAELRSRQYWSSVLKQEPGSLGGDGGVQATLRVRGKKKEKAVGKAVLAAHGQGRSEAFQPLPCQICIEPDSGGIQRGDKAAGRIGLQLSLGLDIDMDSVHVEREGDVGTSAVEATLQRLVRPFTVGVLAKDLGGVGVSGHSMLSMLRVRSTGGARAPKAGVDDGTGATTTFLQFSVLAIDHSSPPPPTLIVSTSPSSQNALDTDQRGRSRSRGNRNSRSGLRNRSSSPPSSPSGLTARRGRSHSPVRSPTWLSRKSPGHINDDDRSLPVAHLQLRATPDALADHAEFLLACKAGVSRDIAAPDAHDEIPDSSTVAENLLHASGEMFTGDSAGLRRAVDCCSLEVHGKSNSASPEDARELVELIYRLKMRRRAARCIAVSAAATYRLRPARRRFHSALQAQKKARYDAKKRAIQVAERRVRLLATYDEQRSTPRKSLITASAKNLDDFASEVLSPMSPSNEKEYDAADDGHKSRTKDAIKFAKAEERAVEMREKAEEAEKTLAEAQMELLKMLDEQMLEVTGPATSTGAFDPDADNTRKEKEDERRRWSQAALAAVRDEVRGKGSLPRWLSKPLLADDVIKRVNTHLQRTILTAVPRNTISVACQSVPGGQKLGTSTPTGPSTPQPWLSHDEGHLATPDEEVSRYRQEARDMLANGTISDGEYIKMVKQATDQEGENQQRKQSAVTRTMEALGQQPAVAMRDDLRARQLEQKEVDSDDGHGFVGRKVKAVDDLLQLVEEDIRLVSQWYDNKDAQHDGGSLDAHEVVELYLNTQAVQIVNFFERLALQCSHRCAQTAPRRRSRVASHSSDFGASDAFVDRGGWRPNDAFSVIFGALRCDARLRRIGKRAQGLREAEQGDVGRHIDLPSAAKAIDIARVCDAYIGIMRDSMGREMLHAVHALAGPGSIDDEEWARRVEEDSGSLNADLLRCLLRYKGRASHVHSSLPSDVFKVVHLHMSLLDSALRTQGSLADTNVADIFTVDAKSADADYSTHLSLRCALRRGLLLAGVETLRQYFTAPLLRAARTAGRRPSGVRSVAKALFSTSQDNLQVPTIESERLLLALCNDCLECSTMIDELLRKYETGDDDTDSDDEDHDDHSVDDGNGCCSLQGPAWRRYRARAKHAFQQQLHQLGNICAERMADKILRVITHSDDGDWLSYQMLFDMDVALPESDGAGVRLRQQRSAGVPSLRRNATRRGSALATPASTGSGNGAHAQHTYRCEATGIVAMTLSEYLGIFGVLMNQYSLIRLQRALSFRLALRYIRAVLLPGIAADGNADVTGGGVARAKAFVTPRKWRQRSAANVMKPPPRGDTVFSDHEMFMRCLAGDTKSETRAVGELDWEWWASGVVLERPQAVKTVARRKKIAESGAMQALSDVATMLMAPNELVEDTSSIVHWFGGVVQRNPSVPTQVFAAVRAAFTARAGASVEGSNGAPPLTQQAVDDALSAIALSRHIRLPDDDDSEILAQHQSTEALHSQESQTLFKDLFPDAVSDFSKFRAAQKKRLQNMRQR